MPDILGSLVTAKYPKNDTNFYDLTTAIANYFLSYLAS